ncbi:MAG: spermidine synthase [Hydrogenovibrio sp.]
MVASIIGKMRRRKSPKGQIVHAVRDGFGLIQVIDTEHTRSLHFGTRVEQSRLYFNAPLTLAFEYQVALMEIILKWAEKHPVRQALTLGLGGGTLATQLHHLFPKCRQTAVELRQAVIDIAHRYFFLPDTPAIQTLSDDAFMYVLQHSEALSYDLVVVDLYDSDSMPTEFTDPLFLQALAQITRPDGLILFNLWKGTPEKTLKVIRYWETQNHRRMALREIQSSRNLILAVEPN